jgi:hypothetical protein
MENDTENHMLDSVSCGDITHTDDTSEIPDFMTNTINDSTIDQIRSSLFSTETTNIEKIKTNEKNEPIVAHKRKSSSQSDDGEETLDVKKIKLDDKPKPTTIKRTLDMMMTPDILTKSLNEIDKTSKKKKQLNQKLQSKIEDVFYREEPPSKQLKIEDLSMKHKNEDQPAKLKIKIDHRKSKSAMPISLDSVLKNHTSEINTIKDLVSKCTSENLMPNCCGVSLSKKEMSFISHHISTIHESETLDQLKKNIDINIFEKFFLRIEEIDSEITIILNGMSNKIFDYFKAYSAIKFKESLLCFNDMNHKCKITKPIRVIIVSVENISKYIPSWVAASKTLTYVKNKTICHTGLHRTIVCTNDVTGFENIANSEVINLEEENDTVDHTISNFEDNDDEEENYSDCDKTEYV